MTAASQQPTPAEDHISIDISPRRLTQQLEELGLGTTEGMRQFVNRIAKRLLSGGHNFSYDDACDAATYAIDQVWEHYLNKGRSIANFSALVYKVALRRAVEDKKNRESQVGTLLSPEDMESLSLIAPDELDSVFLRDLVQSILGNLSGIDRDIMVLIIAGYSPQVIAETLGQQEPYAAMSISARYVRVRLHRIRSRINPSS